MIFLLLECFKSENDRYMNSLGNTCRIRVVHYLCSKTQIQSKVENKIQNDYEWLSVKLSATVFGSLHNNIWSTKHYVAN